MNILVISISLRPQSPVKTFPLGLGYVTTAMKRAGYAFDLLDVEAHRHSDADVEQFIQKKPYDVICMGTIVTGYKVVKSLTALCRRIHPRARIIVGNSVATSIANILLTKTDADIAVMAEGDETIVDLLNTIAGRGSLETVKGICYSEGGRVFTTAPRPIIRDISALPFIDFTDYDIEAYIDGTRQTVSDPLPIARDKVRAMPMNTARGCPGKCSFCYHVFRDVKYRYRNPEIIVAEMESLIDLYGINYFLFSDELTFFSKKQTEAFVLRLLEKKLHVHWVSSCRGDLFDKEEDLELMFLMKEAGCVGMAYSLESADPDILKFMNKKMTTEQFSKQTALFHHAGLPVWTSLVFGYPQETPETIKKTFDCCIENRIYPSAGYLLPQPASPMYDYALEHGYIIDQEEYLLLLGDRQDLRLNMTKMTDEVFQSLILDGLARCNREMKMGLEEDKLIKTQYYRASERI